MKQEFMLGCNYWDSVSGTEMWRKWNPEEVKKDLDALQNCGVKYLRVFPLWRDFQPVKKLYGCCGSVGEYVLGENETDLSENPYALDNVMIERFRTFAEFADRRGMKLIVAIVTGWMSGRLFVPPALDGKNLIRDAEALMWTEKYVKGIVSSFKNIKNIVMWDLGNECNNLSPSASRYESYVWTVMVKNAILAEDNSREISSGMHGLDNNGFWTIRDQGVCDYVTTHPYPSPSIGADTEPYNGLKPTILPTAQSEYYSGLSGKPCIIQEQGTFSQTMGNKYMSADFVRVNVLSAIANGLKGYLWWCAMEHTHLRQAPYSWCNMERQLGMLDKDRNPKPVADVMKKMSELLTALPGSFSKRNDAVCVLSKEINKYEIAAASYVLAKQAGFNLKIQNEGDLIDDSEMYLMPCVSGWAVTHARTLDKILDRVKNHGANFYVSFAGGHFSEFEDVFGLRSYGFVKSNKNHTVDFSFGQIRYSVETEVILKPLNAEVIALNEEGNVVLSVNRFGKGKVYFLNMALEKNAILTTNQLNPEIAQHYYKIYGLFGSSVADKYIVKCKNPVIGVTECVGSDEKDYIFLVNYSNKPQNPLIDENLLSEYTIIYGEKEQIPACDGLILRKKQLQKKQ